MWQVLTSFKISSYLHCIIFTVDTVLQVQVDEPYGEAVTFGGAPAPI